MSDQPGKSVLDDIYPQMIREPHPEEPQFIGPDKIDRSKTDAKVLLQVAVGSFVVIWFVRWWLGLS